MHKLACTRAVEKQKVTISECKDRVKPSQLVQKSTKPHHFDIFVLFCICNDYYSRLVRNAPRSNIVWSPNLKLISPTLPQFGQENKIMRLIYFSNVFFAQMINLISIMRLGTDPKRSWPGKGFRKGAQLLNITYITYESSNFQIYLPHAKKKKKKDVDFWCQLLQHKNTDTNSQTLGW